MLLDNHIEIARETDLPDVAEFLRFQKQELALELGLDIQKSNTWIEGTTTPEAIYDMLSFPPSVLYIIRDIAGQKIQATALVNKRPVDEPPELFGLYVDTAARGNGLGRLLIRKRIEFLKNESAFSARMWILKNNLLMQALAVSEGFENSGKRYTGSTDPNWHFVEYTKTL